MTVRPSSGLATRQRRSPAPETRALGSTSTRRFAVSGMKRIPSEVQLGCRCGNVRGVASKISPYTGFRVLCYCKDCQAFARFLNRADVLDAAGGTDIFQMPTGRLKLTAGMDALRCLRLSEKRILRWYTNCCHTPIGNIAGPRVPLVGVIHSFMNHETDGRSRHEVLGPPLCRIFERSAIGPLQAMAPPPPSMRLLARRVSRMLAWFVRGLAYRSSRLP